MTVSGRVLVVDDDREILEMTALLLRGAGYDVLTAGSGEAGLYCVHQDLPDLVLLDLNMPGLDGWEVLRVLREDEVTTGVPVVLFSVNFEVREKLRALQLGARDYVTKPFDTNLLLERVAALLAEGVSRAPHPDAGAGPDVAGGAGRPEPAP